MYFFLTSSDTTSNKSSTKKKIVTKDKDLLLACSYFDLGHCGYFETKDLEDILTTMNLNLSRAQIKKLLTKVTSGKDQQVNYRQFTDKSEDEELVSSYFFSMIFKKIREIEVLPVMKIQFHLYVVFDFTKINISYFSRYVILKLMTIISDKDSEHIYQNLRVRNLYRRRQPILHHLKAFVIIEVSPFLHYSFGIS